MMILVNCGCCGVASGYGGCAVWSTYDHGATGGVLQGGRRAAQPAGVAVVVTCSYYNTGNYATIEDTVERRMMINRLIMR